MQMADDSDEERNLARKQHQNQPYDESLEVPDSEEVASLYSPTPRVPQHGPGQGRSQGSMGSPDPGMSEDQFDEDYEDKMNPPDQAYADQMRQQQQRMQQQGQGQLEDDDEEDDEDDDDDDDDTLDNDLGPGIGKPPGGHLGGMPLGQGEGHRGKGQSSRPSNLGGQGQFNSDEDEDESGSETTDDEDDDEDDDHVALEGAYDPADYENLPVTPEIKELFQYITRYTPQSIELEQKLKPFIPDFIPAVGDIDAFIKISRPDNKPDTLGLTVLDEPCARQSDPTVLDLQLRAISKQSTDKKIIVKSLTEAEKNPKQIENWIESIRELHRSKPPPNVHYSKNMPDIDILMQEWPPEFEELLKEVGLPTADLDCDLAQYVELVCAILDIPVYKNTSHHNERIQALHVLFTLYSEFKNSQHFRALADENKLDNALKSEYHEDQGPDRFVL